MILTTNPKTKLDTLGLHAFLHSLGYSKDPKMKDVPYKQTISPMIGVVIHPLRLQYSYYSRLLGNPVLIGNVLHIEDVGDKFKEELLTETLIAIKYRNEWF